MIIVRQVFQAQFGQGGALAQAMSAGIPKTMPASWGPSRWRLMTDLSGPFDTVVLEVEAASLAEWEKRRAELFASPAFQEQVGSSGRLMASGRNEFYCVEAEG